MADLSHNSPGSNPASSSPSTGPPGGGTITIAGTTYAVANIGAVQVQATTPERDASGWWALIAAVASAFGLLFGVIFLAAAFSEDARKDIWEYVVVLIGGGLLLSPSFWFVARARRPIYQVSLSVAGVPHVFNLPSQAAAITLRDQIAAAMANAGGNVYVDARQVHVHKS